MAAVSPVTSHRSPETGPEAHVRIEADQALTTLVWRFPRVVLAISSAPLGGGIGRRAWIANAQVPHSYDRLDPHVHLEEMAAALGLTGPGVGMLTAVDLRLVSSAHEDGARADVSVGITHPMWAAAEDEVGVGTDPSGTTGAGSPAPGTINIVASVPVRLSVAALVNAATTVTEAKAQALWDAGVAGTGTPSDALCVVCVEDGPEEPFGGPRSPWGARLARAVHAAVLSGCHAVGSGG